MFKILKFRFIMILRRNHLAKNKELIEFNEQERNIIRYCVEFDLQRRMEAGNYITVEILEPILAKLKKLRERELKDGTNKESIFI